MKRFINIGLPVCMSLYRKALQRLVTMTDSNWNDVILLNNANLADSSCLNVSANDVVLTPIISNISGLTNGKVHFWMNNTSDVSVNHQTIYFINQGNTILKSCDVTIGNVNGLSNESITIFITDDSNGGDLLEMSLTLGHNYLTDGNDHECEIIIDGIDNRFIINGVIYNDVGGNVSFQTGSKTTSHFTDITAPDNAYLFKKRYSSSDHNLYTGKLWDFNINNNIDEIKCHLINSESSGNYIYDRKSLYKFTVNGTIPSDGSLWGKQNKIHGNLFMGFSKVEPIIYDFEDDYLPFYSFNAFTTGTVAINTIDPIEGTKDLKIQAIASSSASFPALNLQFDVPVGRLSVGEISTVRFKYKVTEGDPFLQRIKLGGNNYDVALALSGEGEFEVTGVFSLPTVFNFQFSWGGGTQWTIQLEGLIVVPLSKLPSQIDNPELDVLNEILSNPPIKDSKGNIIGHNNAETICLEPDVQILKDADTDNLLYDVGGASNKLGYDELIVNQGNYFFCNEVEEGKDKRNVLLYSSPRSQSEIEKLIECYSKVRTLPNGYQYKIVNGSPVYDIVNMKKEIELI